MSFDVKTHGNIGAAIRKLARKEIRKAIFELNPNHPSSPAEAVHNARKHFKKLRALLRFVRLEISSDNFQAENACFREAGRKLRDLRDSQVLVTSIDKLRRHFFHGSPAPLLSRARKRLSRDAEQAIKKTGKSGEFDAVTTLLRDALLRVDSWRLADFGWKEARRAIQRSYRQSRRAFRIAAKDPTVENLHEWRKRAKDFSFHARLLRRASPETLAEFANELQALTEFIGEDHDFAMLCEALDRQSSSPRSAKQVESFLTLLHARRKELQHAAFALAERLFASRPSQLARRLDVERTLWRNNSRMAERLEPRLAA